MLRKWVMAMGLVWASLGALANEPMRYIYPPPESTTDQRFVYYWELLDAALKVTTGKWGPYTLSSSPVLMNADRSQILLANSSEITLLARTTSLERERVLLPLRIPLDKGLTGYRLFLTQQATQEQLSAVRTLNDLKPFRIGQGATWIDVEILRSAGLTVEGGSNYDSLFKMLAMGRFEVFSRGINEISKEYLEHQVEYPNMVIEKSLMLYYPLPRYYFFARTPQGERLAKRVSEGLEKLRRSGEFDRRYTVFKRALLADLPLAGRRIFKIPNPTLSPETPLADTRLWDDLAQELKGSKSIAIR